MTLEQIQKDMILALKNGEKERKGALSMLVSAIKKAAIDKNCRDNITEDFVNEVLIKEQKSAEEQVNTCPATRTDLKAEYEYNLSIIKEYAPQLITDTETIKTVIIELVDIPFEKKNRGAIMKILMPEFKGKVDMAVANKVISELIN